VEIKNTIMKKITLPLLASLFAFGMVNAQDKPYNKWSIDLNGGFAKPTAPFTSGYSSKTFENLHLDGGVRYNFNNKFGLKGSFGYDKIDKVSPSSSFDTKYYRTSLEGVVNLGRVLNFENWTRVFNIQAHGGAGYAWMESNNFSGNDQMAHLMAGLTGQVKLHRRVALNADFTVIKNAKQNKAFDGLSENDERGLNGTMFNATVGLSIYLGKHAQHADWYSEESQIQNQLSDLDNRLSRVEDMLVDSDGDGVPDYLDLEPNTPAGALVDSRGRNIDKNNNGIADNIEAYLAEKYAKAGDQKMSADDAAVVKELVNKGYVAVYFDFDKAQPSSTDGINFIVTYLKNNPSASVDVIGYADAVGNKEYNNKLSERRAKSVSEILTKAGISSSRINTIGNGVDDSVAKDSSSARKIARKVVFKIK
jgi:OOP family OmpA-OmpF porin